jgi:DNA replication and repair protein RecF
MFLSKLALLNFKNHASLSLGFSKKINCFIGKNGAGKTNILDSIYYLCLTKSYFNNIDQQNILFGNDFFRLDGDIAKGSEHFLLTYKLFPNKKKELKVNDNVIPRLSDHIGQFPCIIISPNDSELILGSSEERRKFLDGTISQVNHDYLEWLIVYTKLLAQRNAALKRFAETRKTDKELLATYDLQMIPLGVQIHEARKIVIAKLQPIFQSFYREISLERELVSFSYYSQLNERYFGDWMLENFERDVMLQRTDAGVHKDDLEFIIGSNKMKKFGSQGQQKSFIISMKLAQFELIRQATSIKPFLLIDDIFDKLDNDRSRQLIDLIASDRFGQVFLTDTDDAHIRETLQGREDLFEVIQVGA